MSNDPKCRRSRGLMPLIGPGLLVAATGVGAGDLATGALTGARLGTAILWAVLVGAFAKYVLNEGLARWQLATGTTLLEGVSKHFGRFAIGLFLAYLCVWSFFVGSALMSACGVTAHAILPLSDPVTDKIGYGILHSIVALILVRLGGYRLFEKVMSLCVGVMFLTVLASAVAVKPDWSEVLQGLVIPRIPDADGTGVKWTVGLMGGVGGTVTVLCYGYWIREEGRAGLSELKNCRIDLGTGYVMTALFGVGMVILGSQLGVDDSAKPATLVVDLARRLEHAFGAFGGAARLAFLAGAWGAVFSSMLGVWQSVPYLFANCLAMLSRNSRCNSSSDAPLSVQWNESSTATASLHSRVYQWSLLAISVIPVAALWHNFAKVQLAYAIVGAAFMPILAVALLALNGSRKRVGEAALNSWRSTVTLAVVVLFFVGAAVTEVRDLLQ